MKREYRSLFWPVLLISVGILWLLTNAGIIQPVNIVSILNLWPIALIAIGLDLLLGRKSPLVGTIIGFLAVAAVVLLLFFGASLGINTPAQAITERFTDPIGTTTAAEINLDLAERHTDIKALTGSQNLIDATLTHTGTIEFLTSGSDLRNVQLRQVTDNTSWVIMDPTPGGWEIGLAPKTPLDLTIDASSGSNDFNLSGLTLSSAKMDLASGSTILSLPVSTTSYPVEIDSASGSVKVNLPDKTSLTLNLNTASGSINLRMPAGSAIRVDVRDDGSGSLNFDSSLQQISGDQDQGIWQSADYETASNKIEIIFTSRGSGSITIR